MSTLQKHLAVLLLLATTLVLGTLSSCDAKPPEGSRAAQAQLGKEHYMKYCSSCHGKNAKGVQVDSLAVMPPDLTRIQARRKTGEFPVLYVARKIDGRTMPDAHGSRQMPVWGEVFSEEEYLSEAEISGKLAEIIAYLINIQT